MSKLKKITAAAALGGGMALAALPVQAQNAMELNMTTPWAGGHWLDVGANSFANNVETLTEGRIKINVFTAGALGPALKVTETVQTGVADVGHAWPGYDWAIDRTGAIFSGWPAGPNPEEMMMWIYSGGGSQLWRDWRDAVFDVVAIPCGVVETEYFMHSHRPVTTLADLQGLKLRTASSWAEIAPRLGVSTVVLPGSEVFSALERKVVDAIEWGGPGINYDEGFHKIAPYIITPGIHSPAAAHDCIFNKDVWAKIGETDRELIERAAKLTMFESYLGYVKNDMEAFAKIKADPGVTVLQAEQSLIDEVFKVSQAWAAEQADANEWFKRAYESQAAFMEQVRLVSEFRFATGSR